MKRGLCSICGREFQINKDGMVRVHARGQAGPAQWMNCDGSGNPPSSAGGGS